MDNSGFGLQDQDLQQYSRYEVLLEAQQKAEGQIKYQFDNNQIELRIFDYQTNRDCLIKIENEVKQQQLDQKKESEMIERFSKTLINSQNRYKSLKSQLLQIGSTQFLKKHNLRVTNFRNIFKDICRYLQIYSKYYRMINISSFAKQKIIEQQPQLIRFLEQVNKSQDEHIQQFITSIQRQQWIQKIVDLNQERQYKALEDQEINQEQSEELSYSQS